MPQLRHRNGLHRSRSRYGYCGTSFFLRMHTPALPPSGALASTHTQTYARERVYVCACCMHVCKHTCVRVHLRSLVARIEACVHTLACTHARAHTGYTACFCTPLHPHLCAWLVDARLRTHTCAHTLVCSQCADARTPTHTHICGRIARSEVAV